MKLVVADLSNIEGRILAYLAGERWKLQAFRDYDTFELDGNGRRIPDPNKKGEFRRKGPDVYNLTAVGIIGGDPWTVAKPDRNAYGKVADLFGGYEGGVGACQTFAKAYGVKMIDHWGTIQANIAPEHIARARDNLIKFGGPQVLEMGISELEWIASETVKLAWRARHPATRQLWYACKDAAIAAIRSPGIEFPAGQHLRFVKDGVWLLVCLPSGRYLTYYDARADAEGNLTYMGYGAEDGGRRVWSGQYTYGGKIVENACQAIAGDVLKVNAPACEAAGYEILFSVHDELVTQAPDTDEFTSDELARIMATPPVWAPDLPLAAAGFESYRYKKED